MRSRMVRPDFWDDEKLGSIPLGARLLFIGIWNLSDDYGVCRARPSWLRGKLFAYDTEITDMDIQRWLEELKGIDALDFFEFSGERFLLVFNFPKHQNITTPSHVHYAPIPPELLARAAEKKDRYLPSLVGKEEETETETETEAHPRVRTRARARAKDPALLGKVITYFNEKTGKNFLADAAGTVALVRARESEGRTLEDFKRVIDVKVAKWKGKVSFDKKTGDEIHWDDYLRPATLFARSNFESYLNEAMPPEKRDDWAQRKEEAMKERKK